MDDKLPSQPSTLVVLLGASNWPLWLSLDQDLKDRNEGSSTTFAESAKGIKTYFLDPKGFNLPEANLLNLFNSEDDPAMQLRLMGEFFEARIVALEGTEHPATDLIIYYVGHGGFARDDFYLALLRSEESNKIASSLRPESLAEIIKENAQRLRCFLIIDCCFAGQAESAFKGTPVNGVSLLGSSASDKASKAPPDEQYTMFTGALLQVLQQGDKERPEYFTLRTLRDTLEGVIDRTYGKFDGVVPVVHSPVQRPRDIADLPLFPNPGRLPRDARERFFVSSDNLAQCYVIESATEEHTKRNAPLSSTVGFALVKYEQTLNAVIGKQVSVEPVVVNVDQVVASRQAFENAITALCRAEIVVFDVTNYEPAVMLLLGIRSVVRRGVTISSAGGDYVIGDPLDYPFSIKEVNIVSHSERQLDVGDPIDVIGEKIIEGFKQLHYLPDYLDLPVFDAIRTLPPEREQRTPREYSEQVLILCPFNQYYTNNNWKRHLQRYLTVYLSQSAEGKVPRLMRTLDMKSPRLVSQSLYEAIRLTLMCVVDWTEWRPNVFFEMGVRLAAVDIDPVCIVETTHKKIIEDLANVEDWSQRLEEVRARLEAGDDAQEDNQQKAFTNDDLERLVEAAYQCRRLLELFDPIEYRAPLRGRITEADGEPYNDMVSCHKAMIQTNGSPTARKGLMPPGRTYQIISRRIEWRMEISAFPVHEELIRAADLLSDPEIDSEGRSPVLYPDNELLTEKADEGALERRLAAWYYIDNRFEQQEIRNDPALLKKYIDLGNFLARALLRSPREGDKEMAKRIRQRARELQGQRKLEK